MFQMEGQKYKQSQNQNSKQELICPSCILIYQNQANRNQIIKSDNLVYAENSKQSSKIRTKVKSSQTYVQILNVRFSAQNAFEYLVLWDKQLMQTKWQNQYFFELNDQVFVEFKKKHIKKMDRGQKMSKAQSLRKMYLKMIQLLDKQIMCCNCYKKIFYFLNLEYFRISSKRLMSKKSGQEKIQANIIKFYENYHNIHSLDQNKICISNQAEIDKIIQIQNADRELISQFKMLFQKYFKETKQKLKPSQKCINKIWVSSCFFDRDDYNLKKFQKRNQKKFGHVLKRQSSQLSQMIKFQDDLPAKSIYLEQNSPNQCLSRHELENMNLNENKKVQENRSKYQKQNHKNKNQNQNYELIPNMLFLNEKKLNSEKNQKKNNQNENYELKYQFDMLGRYKNPNQNELNRVYKNNQEKQNQNQHMNYDQISPCAKYINQNEYKTLNSEKQNSYFEQKQCFDGHILKNMNQNYSQEAQEDNDKYYPNQIVYQQIFAFNHIYPVFDYTSFLQFQIKQTEIFIDNLMKKLCQQEKKLKKLILEVESEQNKRIKGQQY